MKVIDKFGLETRSHDLLVFCVLKKSFCKNLQLALLFQITLEDAQHTKIQINSSYAQLDGILPNC